jgi:hypothetical protein
VLRRDRRAAERGQTLIFALAFLAFFSLVAASVLTFGSTVESQRASTERTAARDSVAEGSAQFALGDTRGQPCGTVSSGTLQFPSTIQADKLTYGSVGCQHSSAGGIAPGSACVLCLLNSSPPSAGKEVLSTERGLTVNGEVDANGSISGGVTATGPNARVGLLTGASCGSCSPNATTLPTPFNDPLAGALPIPTGNAQTCNACGVISPGVYSNITVTHGTLWMKTGVYIVDSQLKIGGGLLTNADVSSASSTDSDSGGTSDSDSGGSINANSGAAVTYTQRGRRSRGTLVDASKAWTTNQWAGAVVTVTLNNSTETAIVASNTADTLTMSANWNPTPSPGNAYVVSTLGYTSNPTNTLVDTSKEWTTDQWAGSVVQVTLSNNNTETNTVASNTDNTLSMNSAWTTTPSAGDAYVVSTLGYTSNTLVDTSKNWSTDQWAGAVVQVTLSNNQTETNTVASNTDDTLTMSANWNPTPSPGNAYVVSTIGYTSNTLVDTSKTWVTNQWAGAIVSVTLSSSKTETNTIVSNTAHTLTMSSNWGTTPSPGDAYSIVAPVVIYLACPTSGPYWSCAIPGQSGGHMSVTGQGRFAVSAFTSGPYAGISLFGDPNLVDPGGGSVLSLSGNGGSFGGTVYLPRGSVDVSAGGGNGVTVTGRLIVQSLSVSGNEGDSDSLGLSLPGTGPFGALGACEYYNDSLTGTEANGTSQPAHVQFETGCGSAGLSVPGLPLTPTSIINFAYGP